MGRSAAPPPSRARSRATEAKGVDSPPRKNNKRTKREATLTIWHFNAAVSLDMKLARPDGSVDWLADYPPDGADFATFLDSVDLILMGRDTYEAVIAYGGAAGWPYPGKETVVMTSRPLEGAPAEVSTRRDLAATAAEIEGRGVGRVWIEGGGRLLAALAQLDKVDVVELAVIPVVLGAGIPAFPDGGPERWLKLKSAKPWIRDALWLVYRRA